MQDIFEGLGGRGNIGHGGGMRSRAVHWDCLVGCPPKAMIM